MGCPIGSMIAQPPSSNLSRIYYKDLHLALNLFCFSMLDFDGLPEKQSFPDKVLQSAMRAPCVQPLLIRTAGTDVESDIDAVDFRPGQEFVENESQNVTLVLVNLNLGAHLVGGILYLGGQPLLVDLVSFASIDLVERFSVVAYPFGPAVLAAAEHEHRRGAGR